MVNEIRGIVWAVLISVSLATSTALAQTEINVRGSGRLFPIAVPKMCLRGDASDISKQIPGIIARDLDLSGYFDLISADAHIESPGKCAGADGFAYSDWSVIGAEGLVRGILNVNGNELTAQLYLHDVNRQRVLLGREYKTETSELRKVAHRFANEIMRIFTGEPGVFGTQIAFTSKIGRFKELYVMDMDGSNIRQLTDEKGLAMSSSWNRARDSLVYTAFRNRTPDLFTIDVNRKRITQVTRSMAMELGPRFAFDGSGILASRSISSDSDIVIYGFNGEAKRRITAPNGAIDISATYSPDGNKIVFCSNRSGGPQIYTMNSDGSEPRRISFVSSNYCTSPSWSPKGDRIAFVCRAERGFQIFTANPDGSLPLQLTSVGNNEDPDFSPDGRYLVFATTFGKRAAYSLALMRSDGSGMRRLTQSRGGDSEPAWGPMQ